MDKSYRMRKFFKVLILMKNKYRKFRNNQEISKNFLSKLEQALENVHYVDQGLLIFVCLGQKDEKIFRKNLLKIFDQFLNQLIEFDQPKLLEIQS